jgi:hypothetical protein
VVLSDGPQTDAAARRVAPPPPCFRTLTSAASRLGTAGNPAARLWLRLSLARSPRHRSLDVSLELEPRAAAGAPQPALRQALLYEV